MGLWAGSLFLSFIDNLKGTGHLISEDNVKSQESEVFKKKMESEIFLWQSVCFDRFLQSLSQKKFVCFIVPLENFSLIWRWHHYWRRVENFDLCSALTAIEQWEFFRRGSTRLKQPPVYNFILIFVDKNIITVRQCTL